jgi:hypothetical protein
MSQHSSNLRSPLSIRCHHNPFRRFLLCHRHNPSHSRHHQCHLRRPNLYRRLLFRLPSRNQFHPLSLKCLGLLHRHPNKAFVASPQADSDSDNHDD